MRTQITYMGHSVQSFFHIFFKIILRQSVSLSVNWSVTIIDFQSNCDKKKWNKKLFYCWQSCSIALVRCCLVSSTWFDYTGQMWGSSGNQVTSSKCESFSIQLSMNVILAFYHVGHYFTKMGSNALWLFGWKVYEIITNYFKCWWFVLVWHVAISFKPKVHRLALICGHLWCSLIILENQKTDERPLF